MMSVQLRVPRTPSGVSTTGNMLISPYRAVYSSYTSPGPVYTVFKLLGPLFLRYLRMISPSSLTMKFVFHSRPGQVSSLS